MQIVLFYIAVAVLPSIMIYYFSYGNWPLAYNFQLAYAFILSAAFIALFYHSKNNSGGRDSNPIGAAGAIFAFFIFLIPVVLSVAAVALFYKDIAAGEPGIFNPFIKYSFILLTITGLSTGAYYYFSEIYILAISYLPKFIRLKIYKKILCKKKFSYQNMSQLNKIFIKNMLTEKKQDDILLFSKNRDFLYETLFNSALHDDTNHALQKNRELIIRSICCQRSATDYPNKYDLKNILNRIQSAQSLLEPYLDCISKSDELRSLSACFLQDYRLVERIWVEYPYLRPYFYHIDGLKQLELIQKIVSRENPLEYLDDILEKLEVVNKYYREDRLNFDALYTYVLRLKSGNYSHGSV